jgi:hypothetical protein
MIEVSREKLPHLHGRDQRFFANWLSAGLRGFLVEGLGSSAFPGAGNYVGWHEDVIDDLSDILPRLNALEFSEVRLGLSLALAELDFRDDDSLVVAEALIRIAAKVHAPEILDSLPAVINQAASSDQGRLRLLRLAMDLAVEIAGPTEPARRCLGRLIESPGFRRSIAPLALIALCRADPERLLNHMRMLQPHLDALLGWASNWEDEADRAAGREGLIVRVHQLVSARAFCEATEPLNRSSRRDALLGWDDWWFQTISDVRSPAMKRVFATLAQGTEDYLVAEFVEPDSVSGAGAISWLSRADAAGPAGAGEEFGIEAEVDVETALLPDSRPARALEECDLEEDLVEQVSF